MDYSHILQLRLNKHQRFDGANEENVDVQMKMEVNVHIVVPTVDQVHAWSQWNQRHLNRNFNLDRIYQNIAVHVDSILMDTGSNRSCFRFN